MTASSRCASPVASAPGGPGARGDDDVPPLCRAHYDDCVLLHGAPHVSPRCREPGAAGPTSRMSHHVCCTLSAPSHHGGLARTTGAEDPNLIARIGQPRAVVVPMARSVSPLTRSGTTLTRQRASRFLDIQSPIVLIGLQMPYILQGS